MHDPEASLAYGKNALRKHSQADRLQGAEGDDPTACYDTLIHVLAGWTELLSQPRWGVCGLAQTGAQYVADRAWNKTPLVKLDPKEIVSFRG